MTSQWVGDVAIDTKQSCDQQPGSFTQDTIKLDLAPKIQVVGKHGYCTSTTGSSHTSQYKLSFFLRFQEFLVVYMCSCLS